MTMLRKWFIVESLSGGGIPVEVEAGVTELLYRMKFAWPTLGDPSPIRAPIVRES